jgi:hypothetical protein
VAVHAEAEYQRVLKKFPPLTLRRCAIIALVLAAAGTNFFREINWAPLIVLSLAWGSAELTKFRLRRNARQFAEGSR